MAYQVWCMVYGVWCMVYAVWCMVCGVWCMVYAVGGASATWVKQGACAMCTACTTYSAAMGNPGCAPRMHRWMYIRMYSLDARLSCASDALANSPKIYFAKYEFCL